jgi:chromosome condensin MukBEF ATPase and DNA-binding subunit MukB
MGTVMPDEMERRLTVLEVEHKHLVESVDQMSRKVDEMHTLLTQAKGARWAILMTVALSGFIAGSIAPIARLLGIK